MGSPQSPPPMALLTHRSFRMGLPLFFVARMGSFVGQERQDGRRQRRLRPVHVDTLDERDLAMKHPMDLKAGKVMVMEQRWENVPGFQELDEQPQEMDEDVRLAMEKIERDVCMEEERATSDWKPWSRRTGILGRKMRMLHVFNARGEHVPLTPVVAAQNRVVQMKTPPHDVTTALQIGAGVKKLRKVNKPLLGHFVKAQCLPCAKLTEFKVDSSALLSVGTHLDVRHFVPGQYVDIQGYTKGKGFTGAMKRWGFKGLPASHGVSVSHRSLGSTGNRKSPGKVFKGKKMAGHMGVEKVTLCNLMVYCLSPLHDIIYLRGSVPGAIGSWIRMTDAQKRPHTEHPPFPTFVPPDGEEAPDVVWCPDAVTGEEDAIDKESLIHMGLLEPSEEEQAERERSKDEDEERKRKLRRRLLKKQRDKHKRR